eukprot:scaffold7326_cov39-Prasinocladus_malaysianus.AAC.4
MSDALALMQIAEKEAIAAKLQAARDKEATLEEDKKDLNERADDLKAFQDVPDDTLDAHTRARTAEVALADTQKRLESHELTKAKEKAEADLQKAKLELETMAQEKTSVKLECDSLLRQQKELKDQLEHQKAEVEAYIQEIDVRGPPVT